MKKYTLREHPEIKLNFFVDPKFFVSGNKFDMENLEEKIKEFKMVDGKIIVIGEKRTKCSIVASGEVLDKIQLILKDYIGLSIGKLDDIEIY